MSDHDPKLSRRGLLQGAAALGTVTALSGCGDDGGDTGPTADATPLNDMLRAEYQVVANLNESIAVFASMSSNAQAAVLAGLTRAWQSQHREHAAALAAEVTAARGTPVPEAMVTFAMPAGYTRTLANAMRLACNSFKAAALAGTTAVRLLTIPRLRFLAGATLGNDTQHFIAFYSLLLGLAEVDGAAVVVNGVADLVLVPFVSNVTPAPTGTNPTTMMPFTGRGLQGVMDFAYT